MLKFGTQIIHVILTESKIVFIIIHIFQKRGEGMESRKKENVQKLKNLPKTTDSASSFYLGFHKGLLEKRSP